MWEQAVQQLHFIFKHKINESIFQQIFHILQTLIKI